MSLDVNAINGVTETQKYESMDEAGSSVDVSEFFDLMVAQLQNQDPTNPMEDQDFLAQMAQFEALDETRKLNTNIETLVSSQQFAQMANLIGRDVTGVDTQTGEQIQGVVEKVRMKDGSPLMVLQGTTQELKIEDLIEIAPVYISAQ